MLEPYRVLDLTDERGLLCGALLGDLGADVIQVEPPGGSSARLQAPFFRDVADPEHSLYWWAFARNKRSVVLDLDSRDGRESLIELAHSADFLIESETPGVMEQRGLAFEDLASVNPGLIHISITPFGQNGPKARYAASDLIVLAACGVLALCGDSDRSPLRPTAHQAWFHATTQAAVAGLTALHERRRSGLGQHVDVSAQQCTAVATQSDILSVALGDKPTRRQAGAVALGPLVVPILYPAKDGFVSITLPTRDLMECIYEGGGCDEEARDKNYMALLKRGTSDEWKRTAQILSDFTRTKSKAELGRAAQERGWLLYPVENIEEVLENEQLRDRKYFVEVEYENLGLRVHHPGAFAKFGRSPVRPPRRAPLLGEHSGALLGTIRGAVARAAVPEATKPSLPLSGVKVLDFSWVLAGPLATRVLADCGATVVRVESRTRPDDIRFARPFQGGRRGPERSATFHNANIGKQTITLDLRKPEGRKVVLDLVRWADVVVETFSPGTMAALGLAYEDLVKVNPQILMLSSCLMGQTGPQSGFAGYGNLAAAMTGFFDLTGWPDRPPAAPYGAYTDYVAPAFTALAILAALEHRSRTGEGQRIDLSQGEASLHFLSPTLLDYTANGRVGERCGNRDLTSAPHGVYPADGDDRWVAIAVEDDAQWRALSDWLGRPELGSDPRYTTVSARLDRTRELDALIGEKTRALNMHRVEADLQSRGVPAHAVLDSAGLANEPQLRHRGHFASIEPPGEEATLVEDTRFKLSRTPAQLDQRLPTLGRDTHAVLKELLGYSDERIAELSSAGALD